jgi:hypothetical protein
MSRVFAGLLAAVCAVAVCARAAAPIDLASFDNPASGWTALRGAAHPDPAAPRQGRTSLRVEPSPGAPDASVRSAPVSLAIGRRYELVGWVRTEALAIRDLDRSPIATGATIAMASMPFDVHSASLAGTRPWTRVSLRFTATRAQDRIVLTVGQGGAFQGKAWFEGISLDEASAAADWPIRDAVETFGPAYRYPSAGWIYLHIEGAPYERGYQHGHLMKREIPEYLDRCAAELGSRDQWGQYRTMANALFLRGFDREILEEMRGIADGASDAGATWQGRRLDLTDIVLANVTVEMSGLREALATTPTGLEGLSFERPPYAGSPGPPSGSPANPASRRGRDRCSSFAATGPATRDGKMVVGHVTWWPLNLAGLTNVLLDIKPAAGHRMLIQSYPGGIESGTDWYQNDAGIVLTETTIGQTPFNLYGTPVAFRARMAIQYSASIDEVVQRLGDRNNGLYTNEWLVGDAKTNEIAMYDLGTSHTRLWRSSRDEWFGGTTGFYWSNNNAKDLAVRLETVPDPQGAPGYVPYVPAPRDLAWQDLYRQYRGQIDEQFAFLAFRTAPLVSASTMDAKVATAELASRFMLWAAIGKPNQREWVAPQGGTDGLYPSGYQLFTGDAPAALAIPARVPEKPQPAARPASFTTRLWKGWVLPASDADIWLAAGSAAYYRVLASGDPEKSIDAWRIRWRGLQLVPPDSFRLAEARGVLFLDSLRRRLGDDAFFKLMTGFFAAHAGRTATAAAFLQSAGAPFEIPDPGPGPAYLAEDLTRRLASAVLVYGTDREAGANRYAAERLQSRFLDQYESAVPIYKDFEATEDLLAHRDVVFVGRPEANSALAAWADRLGLDYSGAAFRLEGALHASERDALQFAARNPLDSAHMVLVVAGNDALRTVKAAAESLFPSPYKLLFSSTR